MSIACGLATCARARAAPARATRRAARAASRAPAAPPEKPMPGDDHRQAQPLAHADRPSASSPRKASGSRANSPMKRDDAVADQEQRRHLRARPRLRGEPPQQREQREALRAPSGRAATDGAARRPRRGTPCPRAASVTRPQSSPLMKLPRRPAARPSGTSGATKSIRSHQLTLLAPGDERHRRQHAEEAAVERHAALPDREDLQRMREVVARLVEQHVAQAPAEDHADDAAEQQVVELRARDRRQACVDAPRAQPPERRRRRAGTSGRTSARPAGRPRTRPDRSSDASAWLGRLARHAPRVLHELARGDARARRGARRATGRGAGARRRVSR